MARKPRIEYAGAVYHVTSRGDRRDDIFRTDRDRLLFLDTLSESCERQGWLVHAYVLMGNHYHLLLETPEPNLVVGMKWLQGTYTQRFNCSYRECGHLFQGRYKALVVQSDKGDYFATVATYIHLNPVRAGLLDSSSANLVDYPWSSYPLYLDPGLRPPWLHIERVLGAYGFADDREGLARFRLMMTRRTLEICRGEDPTGFDQRWNDIRRGWCLGGETFRSEMEGLVDERISQYDRRSYLGDEARKHDEAEALRLLRFGLEALGVHESLLPELKKNDPRKKVVAWLIRRKTSVKNDWISRMLSMGRSSNLARLVKEVQTSTDRETVRMRKMMEKAF